MTTPPLVGITVLNLSENLPGPYATMVLADLGADVINIERPVVGDASRALPELFASTARGKRSVVLDLKSDQGQADLARLARDADVIVEGFRPGTVDRLKADYASLRAVNDQLVYVSISGFGQDGPLRLRPGHDIVFQALAGMLGSRPAADPGPVPDVVVADLAAATFAVVAVVTGLFQRTRTGAGCYVDVSMLDVLVSWMGPAMATNAADPPYGLPPHLPGYGLYATADGKIITLGITLEDHLWADLCHVVGLPELADVDADERLARPDALDDALRRRIATEPAATWLVSMEKAGIAFSLVAAPSEVGDIPQVASRGLVFSSSGSDGRRLMTTRQPLIFDGDLDLHVARAPVPALGEHTEQILGS